MPDVTVKSTVNASVAKVWQSWDAIADIYVFSPGIKSSYLLNGSAATGLGARRQCDFVDGKNHIREEIVGYEPERKLVIDIYEGTMPLRSVVATFRFTSRAREITDVSMTMAFKPKFGPVGALMVPMMKRQFRPILQSMLDGNAACVERGETVAQAA